MRKAFVIGMMDNHTSQLYMKKTLPVAKKMLSLVDDVELFPAITPGHECIDHNKFAAIKRPTNGTQNKPFSDTEQAVWYSHLHLWEKILTLGDEHEYWILEHDALLTTPPKLDFGVSAVFANNIGCALAYTIDPIILQWLLGTWEKTPRIDMQVDTFMADWFEKRPVIKQSALTFPVEHLSEFGTTITHL
jgi:hypothetical protein